VYVYKQLRIGEEDGLCLEIHVFKSLLGDWEFLFRVFIAFSLSSFIQMPGWYFMAGHDCFLTYSQFFFGVS
jgi:hypothetical protein